MSQVWMSMGPLPSYAFIPKNEIAAMMLVAVVPTRGQASSSLFCVRVDHRARSPRPIATLARKVQNQANPFASAICRDR